MGARPPGRADGVLRDAAAIMGLALVVGLLFCDAVLGRGVFFQRDIHAYWQAQNESLKRILRDGSWPLWNPYFAFGAPLLADPGYQVLYPPTWLSLALPAASYYKGFVILHVLMAGAGLFVLGRRLGLGRLSAFLTGAVGCSAGPFVSLVCLNHHFAGASWIPWILAALDRALERATPGAIVLLAATAAGQAFAGSADMCVISVLLAAGFSVAWLLGLVPLGGLDAVGTGARPPRLFAVCLAAATLTLLLSAAQWLPALDLARSSGRRQVPRDGSMFWSLHPASLLDLLVPQLTTGLAVRPEIRAALFDGREPFLASLYLGVGAATLGVLSLAAKRSRLPIILAAGVVFFVLTALGRHGPLFPLLLRIPPFEFLRYPVKYMVPVAFLSALLAGCGMEACLRESSGGERRLMTALAAGSGLLALLAGSAPFIAPSFSKLAGVAAVLAELAAVAALSCVLLLVRSRRPGAPPGWPAAMTAVAVLDLVAAGSSVNHLAPPELLAHRPPALSHLGEGIPGHRVYVEQEPLAWLNEQLVRGPAGWDREWGFALGARETLLPPTGGLWGLEGSYDGDFTGLAPVALSDMTLLVGHLRSSALGLRLLELGNVTDVISFRRPAFPGLEERAEMASVFAPPLRLFRVPTPLPRSYVVDGVRAASEPQSFGVLVDPGFDPRREVILPVGEARVPREGFHGASRLLARQADAVTIDVEADGPGYVILVEAYDKGWRATVDGTPAEVLRANVLFRAVAVPAGSHVVEQRYRPKAVLCGAGLSGLGLLAAGALAVGRAGPRPV